MYNGINSPGLNHNNISKDNAFESGYEVSLALCLG
jgi:hypothetical protein